MTTIKHELNTKNVTVEIEQIVKNKGIETESIYIAIRDNKTKEILKNFTVMDSKDLKYVWICNSDIIKKF